MKKVYVTVQNKGRKFRLCGILPQGEEIVSVHIVHGPRLGGFNLSRLGGKLTEKTLFDFFSTKEV